ncbi:MAG: hypothetical protein WD889_02855 [Candidatus Colwellbacteria bacterium]
MNPESMLKGRMAESLRNMRTRYKWLLGFIIIVVIGVSYLWIRMPSKAERECADETFKQPYVSQDYYIEYFKECLIEKGARERDPILIPPDVYIEDSA